MVSNSCNQYISEGCWTGKDEKLSILSKMFNFQPAFVNNPLLGAIILAGLFLYDVEVGLGCILGGMTATLTDLVLSLHPLPDLNAGVASFNGVLVGTVIPILFPVFNHLPRSTEMWLAIFVGAITSAFLARAFGNFLSKFDVPYMALPFNLIAVCVFLTLQPLVFTPENMSDSDMQGEANITLEWDKVGRGIVVSMGQVYAVKELEPSIVINLAVLLSSPLLFLMSTLGATLSTLTSLVFLEPSEYEAVYDGEPLGKFYFPKVPPFSRYLGLQRPPKHGGRLLRLLSPDPGLPGGGAGQHGRHSVCPAGAGSQHGHGNFTTPY